MLHKTHILCCVKWTIISIKCVIHNTTPFTNKISFRHKAESHKSNENGNLQLHIHNNNIENLWNTFHNQLHKPIFLTPRCSCNTIYHCTFIYRTINQQTISPCYHFHFMRNPIPIFSSVWQYSKTKYNILCVNLHKTFTTHVTLFINVYLLVVVAGKEIHIFLSETMEL